jgi:hypothetical protein
LIIGICIANSGFHFEMVSVRVESQAGKVPPVIAEKVVSVQEILWYR